MKFPDPASIGVTDLVDVMNQQAEVPGDHDSPRVYVWELRERNTESPNAAASYLGAHSTSAGAWLALKAKAVEISDTRIVLAEDADLAQICSALDASGVIDSYGVSSLPVLTP